MALHPQAKALLDVLNLAPQVPTEDLDHHDLREQYLALSIPATAVGVITEDRIIAGPRGDIALRIYRPEGAGVTPVVVYFHGGGWVIGNIESHDGTCASITAASGCTLVSVDYRLAPESPFPAAIEDGFAATIWVQENAEELGVDGTRLAVAGDSAGGNIAAVVSQIARDVGGIEIAFQLLVYPVTDYEFTSESMIDNSEGYLLTTELMRWFYGHYLNGDAEAGSDPRVSPLRADDLSDLPPAYVITAGYDPLRDQGIAYADAMTADGVKVELVHYEGMFHGFFGLESVLDNAGEAIAHASAALRVALAVE